MLFRSDVAIGKMDLDEVERLLNPKEDEPREPTLMSSMSGSAPAAYSWSWVKDGEKKIDADELAHIADTINYEIICGFGNRLEKIYIEE